MSNLFFAKEKGQLDSGVKYTILQDGPTSFHVTAHLNNDEYFYEHFNPTSLQDLRDGIARLGDEIINGKKEEVLTIPEEAVSLNTITDASNNQSNNKEETNEQV